MSEIKITPSAELEAKLRQLVNDPNIVPVDDIATAALWVLLLGMATYEERSVFGEDQDHGERAASNVISLGLDEQ